MSVRPVTAEVPLKKIPVRCASVLVVFVTTRVSRAVERSKVNWYMASATVPSLSVPFPSTFPRLPSEPSPPIWSRLVVTVASQSQLLEVRVQVEADAGWAATIARVKTLSTTKKLGNERRCGKRTSPSHSPSAGRGTFDETPEHHDALDAR